jgi:transposase-like protein
VVFSSFSHIRLHCFWSLHFSYIPVCFSGVIIELLAFYDFPAEHWAHLRTTNPIESTFATVRLRTGKTRGCLSRKTGPAMVFKLMQSAQKRWRKLNGENRAAEVIEGVNFKDGITAKNEDLRNAA